MKVTFIKTNNNIINCIKFLSVFNTNGTLVIIIENNKLIRTSDVLKFMDFLCIRVFVDCITIFSYKNSYIFNVDINKYIICSKNAFIKLYTYKSKPIIIYNNKIRRPIIKHKYMILRSHLCITDIKSVKNLTMNEKLKVVIYYLNYF